MIQRYTMPIQNSEPGASHRNLNTRPLLPIPIQSLFENIESALATL